MRADQFFEAADPQNIVKTSILTNYFRAWTTIMLPQLRRPEDCLAYIDLFAGPGRFEDGSPSTPLWVLSHSIEDPRLRTRLVTVFNDKEPGLASRLQQEIASLPGV